MAKPPPLRHGTCARPMRLFYDSLAAIGPLCMLLSIDPPAAIDPGAAIDPCLRLSTCRSVYPIGSTHQETAL